MNTLLELLNQSMARSIGWALLHSLWQGAIAAILFALLRLVLRKHTPHVRYLAGCSVLLMVAAAPVLTVCSGRLTVSGLHGSPPVAPFAGAFGGGQSPLLGENPMSQHGTLAPL